MSNATEEKQIIRRYLAEIGNSQLMTAEEEQALCRKIKKAQITLVKVTLGSDVATKSLINACNLVMHGELSRDDVFYTIEAGDLAIEKRDSSALNNLAAYLIELCQNYRGSSRLDQLSIFERMSRMNLADLLFRRIAQSIRADDAATSARLQDGLKEITAAKHTLIERNLKLAASVAKLYSVQGLEPEDLVQEANLGLMKAVDRFDFERGLRFSTYAHWWVRQALGRAIADQSRMIRIPVNLVESINQVTKCMTTLSGKLLRDPTPEEIAVELDLPVARVTKALKAVHKPISLDTAWSDDGEAATLYDMLADDSEAGPESAVMRTVLLELIVEVFGSLTEREQMILRLRFGFEDALEDTKSLDSISKLLDVSRETVRQIELATYQKIKDNDKFSSRLKDFFN